MPPPTAVVYKYSRQPFYMKVNYLNEEHNILCEYMWNISEWTENSDAAGYAAGYTVHEAHHSMLSRVSILLSIRIWSASSLPAFKLFDPVGASVIINAAHRAS